MTFDSIRLLHDIDQKKFFKSSPECEIRCDIVNFGIRLDIGHIYFIPWSSIKWVKKGEDEMHKVRASRPNPKAPISEKGTSRKPTQNTRKRKGK